MYSPHYISHVCIWDMLSFSCMRDDHPLHLASFAIHSTFYKWTLLSSSVIMFIEWRVRVTAEGHFFISVKPGGLCKSTKFTDFTTFLSVYTRWRTHPEFLFLYLSFKPLENLLWASHKETPSLIHFFKLLISMDRWYRVSKKGISNAQS